MYEIIELAANATDLAILFYAVDRFSERKGKFNLKAIFALLFIQSVFMRYTNELFGNASMASATVNIGLFFFIASFFYKINLRQIIGVTAVILLAMLICEGIVTTFMDAVLDTGMEGLIKYNSFYRAVAILISKAITAILAVNIFNFIDKEEISASKYFPVISAIVIVNILLHLLMLEFYTGNIEKYIDTHIAVLVFFILINTINILSFFIIIRMIKYIEKETRWNMTVKGYEKQIEYLKSYNSVTVEMRKLRHDLTKHVIVLSDYLNSGRVKDAGNYINEILESYKSINEIASIQNKIISSIINYNIKITAENNIHFNFYADVPEKMHVKDIDITIVLGNIMENAIEACGKIPENENREIELYIEYNKGILFIKAINTYSGTLPEKGGRILTDKKDRQNHGFGIENIKNTVARYGGSFGFYTKGNKFYVEIRM